MFQPLFGRYKKVNNGEGGWGKRQAYAPPAPQRAPPRIPERLEGHNYRDIIQSSALKWTSKTAFPQSSPTLWDISKFRFDLVLEWPHER